MLSDINNVRQLVELLGDDGFTEAITQAEDLVNDVNDTLDRVERVEDEAGEAVKEANRTLTAVDRRLDKVDRTINLLEAKIEAGFSLGFFVFAVNFYLNGDLLFAASLAFMGLLGAGQLLVTIRNIPQVEKIRWLLGRLAERLGYPELAERIDVDERTELPGDDSANQRPRVREGR
jgi:hypothetical protein